MHVTRGDREDRWDVCRIYGMVGRLLEGMRAFHEDACVSKRVDR